MKILNIEMYSQKVVVIVYHKSQAENIQILRNNINQCQHIETLTTLA